ncbi:nuclear transport factor 2 family protein [Arthrobacter sp. ISL-30]|uniref:nuclear transport factor 2 family protein n=1 Tax=Arthrobacter sp. ISL-30 TaxID=2819109 RepID=UPI001BEC03EF|nr:nuclear transport factor 2 family protein [Arthrobacter sp. ISL-30]MBT2513607.1 nuclear transport factor 2 family protein [Arthrobacter sp. ISL-30]
MSHSPAEVRHAVENLLGRYAEYAEYADERDAAGVAELFSDAVVSFAGTTLGTADEISGHYGRIFAAAPPSRHVLTNIIVDRAGSTATARCRYSRWAIEPDAKLLALGDYRATFAGAEGAWKFISFEVSRAWQA